MLQWLPLFTIVGVAVLLSTRRLIEVVLLMKIMLLICVTESLVLTLKVFHAVLVFGQFKKKYQ